MVDRLPAVVPLFARLSLFFVAAAALAGVFWWWQGRTVELPPAPEGRLPCVSYTPFHDGQDPLDPATVVSRAEIRRDLDILASRFRCVRTYSVSQGLAAVVPEAAARDLGVILGVWIGTEEEKNEKEMNFAVALANAYPRTVRAIVVGNEVLLRSEQTGEALAAMLRRVKARVPVTVTYADVWEFWLKHPVVANAADVVTIHILPYWEDEPRAVDEAVPYAFDVVTQMERAFPGKPVFIGEIGWPSRGRTRHGAVPGAVEQARFMRAFIAEAQKRGLSYYTLFEAFDQPWKRRLEGTVGGSWGLYAADGTPKFPFTGPVARDPRWRGAWLASVGLGTLLLFGAVGRLRPAGFLFSALGAAYALAAGTGLVVHLRHVAEASRTSMEEALGLAMAALAGWAACLSLRALARRADPSASPAPVPFALATVAAALRREPKRLSAPGGVSGLVWATGAFFAAFMTLVLVFDPRYRDFSWGALLPIAVGFFLWSLLWPPSPGTTEDERFSRREERGLAVLLWAGALILVAKEGAENAEAAAWAVLATLLGTALARTRRRR